ncbi:MAG: helix-turn-helix domain-containing protein [Chloroflexi bacterium]|nr:helix-turn-helix domain-containing protein [Chloroflexota bacterium]
MRVVRAAALANLDPSTIYKWVREGRIDSYRVGRVIHVDLDQVQKAQQRHRASKDIPLPPQNLVPLGDAAAQTGIPKTTLHRWCNEKRITAEKYGSRWYVNLEDIRQVRTTLKRGPQPKAQ